MILTKLKEAAESYLGEKGHAGGHHVPAYFNDAQRQSTKDAGKIAGLEVMRIINEPTAARWLTAWIREKTRLSQLRFRRRTFDISILEVGEGLVEVKSTNGDTHLAATISTSASSIGSSASSRRKTASISPRIRWPPAPQGGRRKGQDGAFHAARNRHQSALRHGRCHRSKHLQMKLTRARFEQMWRTFCSAPSAPASSHERCRGHPSQIDEVVMVGGQTRMPRIQALVRELFNKEPTRA